MIRGLPFESLAARNDWVSPGSQKPMASTEKRLLQSRKARGLQLEAGEHAEIDWGAAVQHRGALLSQVARQGIVGGTFRDQRGGHAHRTNERAEIFAAHPAPFRRFAIEDDGRGRRRVGAGQRFLGRRHKGIAAGDDDLRAGGHRPVGGSVFQGRAGWLLRYRGRASA